MGAPMFKHILIGFDGSAYAREAFDTAVAMATALGSRLTVLQILPSYESAFAPPHLQPHAPARELYESRALASAQQAVAPLARSARTRGVECDAVFRFGTDAYRGILEHASSTDCDLIVLGARGERSSDPLLLGNATASILLHARVPVLINDGLAG